MGRRRGPVGSLVGMKFGRWTVLSFDGFGGREPFSKNAMWQCVCECGTRRSVIGHSIRFGRTQSGYSPDNCRWATSSQQARNRITSRIVSAFGLSLTLAEWAERTGIDYCVLWARISVLRWDPERAFMEGAKEVIWPSI